MCARVQTCSQCTKTRRSPRNELMLWLHRTQSTRDPGHWQTSSVGQIPKDPDEYCQLEKPLSDPLCLEDEPLGIQRTEEAWGSLQCLERYPVDKNGTLCADKAGDARKTTSHPRGHNDIQSTSKEAFRSRGTATIKDDCYPSLRYRIHYGWLHLQCIWMVGLNITMNKEIKSENFRIKFKIYTSILSHLYFWTELYFLVLLILAYFSTFST